MPFCLGKTTLKLTRLRLLTCPAFRTFRKAPHMLACGLFFYLTPLFLKLTVLLTFYFMQIWLDQKINSLRLLVLPEKARLLLERPRLP